MVTFETNLTKAVQVQARVLSQTKI